MLAAPGSGRAPGAVLSDVPSGTVDPSSLTLLALLARGLPLERVARELHCSERTVRRRTRAVCDRLGVGTPVEAVVWAARRGLL